MHALPGAWPLLYIGLPCPGSPPQGVGGSLKFPGYPFGYMPRSQTPVVSLSTRLGVSRTLAFRRSQTVGFPPARAGLSFRTTTMKFSQLSHAACTLATPGFTHTLAGYACRFTTDLAAHLFGWDLYGKPYAPTG